MREKRRCWTQNRVIPPVDDQLRLLGKHSLFANHSFSEVANMDISPNDTAVVVTDPQNDFLSPDGATWELVGKSVEENGTVEHIETLLKTAKTCGYPVFVSPHYYYPTDKGWKVCGTV